MSSCFEKENRHSRFAMENTCIQAKPDILQTHSTHEFLTSNHKHLGTLGPPAHAEKGDTYQGLGGQGEWACRAGKLEGAFYLEGQPCWWWPTCSAGSLIQSENGECVVMFSCHFAIRFVWGVSEMGVLDHFLKRRFQQLWHKNWWLSCFFWKDFRKH